MRAAGNPLVLQASRDEAVGTIGNLSRNKFIGPGIANTDASLQKNIFWPGNEHRYIQLRVDAFNLFNNLNMDGSTISTNFTSTNFGQVQKALGSRTLDIQARFSF